MENNFEFLRHTSSWLSEMKISLRRISKDNEPKFVKLSQELQFIYSDAEIITRSAVEAASHIEGNSDESLLTHIDSLAEGSLNNVKSFKSGMADMFPKFESCLNYMRRLNDACPGIIKISKMLNMIALNISVESNRNQTCEDMFRFFVQEIKELAKKANEMSFKIREDSETSKANQENDYVRILERRDQLDRNAIKAKEIISENVKRVEEVMSLSRDILMKSEMNSQKISELVGEIVMAIQFHDIAKQQIEHIVEALQDIEDQIKDRSGLQVNQEEDSIFFGKTYSILNIQVPQIQQVVSEIDKVYEKTLKSFEQINCEIESIVNGIIRIGRGNADEIQERSAFKLLLSGFGELEITIANGEELRKQIDDSMKRTSESASVLSTYLNTIEDLSMQLHIKSMNALIMSKKLGQSGVTLSVLAEYLTDGAKKSDSFVLDVVEILKLLLSSANDLNDNSFETNVATSNKQQSSRYVNDGISFISELYKKFLAKAEDAHQYSIELRNKISGIKSGLAFLNEMKSDLEKCLSSTRTMIDTLSPFSSLQQDITMDLAKIKNRYTMQIERGIHEKAVGIKDVSFAVKLNKPQNDDNDFGDNVELF